MNKLLNYLNKEADRLSLLIWDNRGYVAISVVLAVWVSIITIALNHLVWK